MAQQEKGIKLRAWTLHAEDYIDANGYDTGFRQAVAEEMSKLEHMGERFGVGFVVAPIRREIRPGEFETFAWAFQSETIPAAAKWEPDPIALGDENAGTAEAVLAGVGE